MTGGASLFNLLSRKRNLCYVTIIGIGSYVCVTAIAGNHTAVWNLYSSHVPSAALAYLQKIGSVHGNKYELVSNGNVISDIAQAAANRRVNFRPPVVQHGVSLQVIVIQGGVVVAPLALAHKVKTKEFGVVCRIFIIVSGQDWIV